MKNLFFISSLGFTPFWVYKPIKTYVDIPGVYISENILNLSTTNKIHLKCDVNDGSLVNGVRQPIPFSFFLMNQAVRRSFINLKQLIIKNK